MMWGNYKCSFHKKGLVRVGVGIFRSTFKSKDNIVSQERFGKTWCGYFQIYI